jgi:hypothetical protein
MKEKSSGDLVAVKLIPKPLTAGQIEAIRLETKIQVWMGRGCVNVVPAKGVLVSKTHVGIVLEYEAGNQLGASLLLQECSFHTSGTFTSGIFERHEEKSRRSDLRSS